jgi:prepilin-type N-terminal cleavage/methylation domain-containing protein
MQIKSISRRSGFTLVEIMIVVAIIALLAAIAVPSFLRARKRSQATSSLETLRILDAAKDQYAIDNGKTPGLLPTEADLVNYVKTGTKLYTDMQANNGPFDALGNTIDLRPIDTPPQVAQATKDALSDALGTNPDDFWGPYTGQ